MRAFDVNLSVCALSACLIAVMPAAAEHPMIEMFKQEGREIDEEIETSTSQADCTSRMSRRMLTMWLGAVDPPPDAQRHILELLWPDEDAVESNPLGDAGLDMNAAAAEMDWVLFFSRMYLQQCLARLDEIGVRHDPLEVILGEVLEEVRPPQ